MKDLFETIDVRKDGFLDMHEWQQTFGRVEQANSKISFRTNALSMWESSREYGQITGLMAKNRKLLAENFRRVLGEGRQLFDFSQGKQAMDDWLYSHFGEALTDEHLKCLFRPAQIHSESQGSPKYDYVRLLEINKSRHTGAQL